MSEELREELIISSLRSAFYKNRGAFHRESGNASKERLTYTKNPCYLDFDKIERNARRIGEFIESPLESERFSSATIAALFRASFVKIS